MLERARRDDAAGLRDRAILETLYSTGMRRMRARRAWRSSTSTPSAGTVMVRQGKGKKDRMVPIGERALAWIEKYLAEVRPELVVEPDEATLFLTHLGERASRRDTLTQHRAGVRARRRSSARRARAISSGTRWRR